MNTLEKSIAAPPRSHIHLFTATEHQNFFGMDDRLGPVAISFRREEKEGSSGAQYNCRIIFRTTEVCVSLLPRCACRLDGSRSSDRESGFPSDEDAARFHPGGVSALGRTPHHAQGPVSQEAAGVHHAGAQPALPALGVQLAQGPRHSAEAGRAGGE